jgi:hypothetical protein
VPDDDHDVQEYLAGVTPATRRRDAQAFVRHPDGWDLHTACPRGGPSVTTADRVSRAAERPDVEILSLG